VTCLRLFRFVDSLAEHVSKSLSVEIKVHLPLDQLRLSTVPVRPAIIRAAT
jgi:hypothetical protein